MDQTEVKRCSHCGIRKGLQEFDKYFDKKRGKYRWKNFCKKCRVEYDSRRRSTPEYLEKARSYRSKVYGRQDEQALRQLFNQRLGGYKRTAAKWGVPYEVSAGDLISLYNKQHGMCYYTGIPVVWGEGRYRQYPDSLSVDRKSPDKGYTPENVVICCLFVNTAKGVLTEEEFYKFCEFIYRVGALRQSRKCRTL